jgi:hypothetical protein
VRFLIPYSLILVPCAWQLDPSGPRYMGSIALEEVPSESFGYDFEDEQTKQELKLIDDLQNLGVSKYLDLPQVSNICLSFEKTYS